MYRDCVIQPHIRVPSLASISVPNNGVGGVRSDCPGYVALTERTVGVQNLRCTLQSGFTMLESMPRAANDRHWQPTGFPSWHHLQMFGIGPYVLTLFYNHFWID